MERLIEVQALRPRLKQEYGDGYVLSVTVENCNDPKALASAIKDMQQGYIRVILSKE